MNKNTIITVMAIAIIGLSAMLILNKGKAENNSTEHNKEHVNQDHKHDNGHGDKHGDKQEKHGKHGKANEHMHQNSVEQLSKNFDSSERDDYQKPEKVLNYLGNIEGKTIMDIGAGSGYFSVKLANKGANVIAADVDDEFQNIIKTKMEKEGIENIELRKLEYDDPLLQPSEVDMVLIVNTYHHIENRSDYFAKVKQGIKADGELVIIDFFKEELPIGPPSDHKISMDKAIAELKVAGYTDLEVDVNLLPYQFIIRAK